MLLHVHQYRICFLVYIQKDWHLSGQLDQLIWTAALRDLVGCGENDMIVGLIMIGWPKRVPRMPRRRRDRDRDVLKDVII